MLQTTSVGGIHAATEPPPTDLRRVPLAVRAPRTWQTRPLPASKRRGDSITWLSRSDWSSRRGQL
ncbi:hypothetical protein XMIN_869 [Xanthomonas citri pv. mangiferaeindicae LMG 941]|nr:hypothetical protein XMIN_869 [Xanthomonas citri pv. mangiferaeindicae LMG 941]